MQQQQQQYKARAADKKSPGIGFNTISQNLDSPPPPYEQLEAFSFPPSDRAVVSARAPAPVLFHQPASASQRSLLPCVVPQVTTSLRGAFCHPFVRAYPREYAARGIPRETFVTFIDGLNEAFMANPILQATEIAGGMIGFIPDVSGATTIASTVISLTAKVSTFAVSYVRTKAFLEASNEAIFHPAGLHVQMLSTKKMCPVIDYPEEKLQLLPREHRDAAASASPSLRTSPSQSYLSAPQDSYFPPTNETPLAATSSFPLSSPSSSTNLLARPSPSASPSPALPPSAGVHARRVESLRAYVLPLDYDIPDIRPRDRQNLLKRVGDYQARWAQRSGEKSMNKKRARGERKYAEALAEAERERVKMQAELEKLERRMNHKADAYRRDLTKRKVVRDPAERAKVDAEFGKERAKFEADVAKVVEEGEREIEKKLEYGNKKWDKVDRKETKVANKVRWIVITEWSPEIEAAAAQMSDEEEYN